MAQRICSIDDCENPMWARTYCQRHYNLWRNRGSAEVEPIRISGRICSVEGCRLRANARQLCSVHYLRAVRSGGNPGDVYERPDTAKCWWCHKEFNLIDGRRLYCSDECAKFVKSLWNVSRYGITRDDYRDAWYRQGGVCVVCKHPERTARNHLLSIDHDHETGRFRGLLCSHCNRAIGLLQDDPKIIAAAADYLLQGVTNNGFI